VVVKITDILVKESILLDLTGSTKADVLAEMANALARSEPELDELRILEVLIEREKLGSTGIGEGVAIPHGSLLGLSRFMASFARSCEGVDFDSIDGQPTHLFFLLLSPEYSTGQHLRALARVSRLLRDASFRERLLDAETQEEVYRAIEEEDLEYES
jgi:PTS system nitrogen regulatory IIA component